MIHRKRWRHVVSSKGGVRLVAGSTNDPLVRCRLFFRGADVIIYKKLPPLLFVVSSSTSLLFIFFCFRLYLCEFMEWKIHSIVVMNSNVKPVLFLPEKLMLCFAHMIDIHYIFISNQTLFIFSYTAAVKHIFWKMIKVSSKPRVSGQNSKITQFILFPHIVSFPCLITKKLGVFRWHSYMFAGVRKKISIDAFDYVSRAGGIFSVHGILLRMTLTGCMFILRSYFLFTNWRMSHQSLLYEIRWSVSIQRLIFLALETNHLYMYGATTRNKELVPTS